MKNPYGSIQFSVFFHTGYTTIEIWCPVVVEAKVRSKHVGKFIQAAHRLVTEHEGRHGLQHKMEALKYRFERQRMSKRWLKLFRRK